MATRRTRTLVIVMTAPLLLAASDPSGDVRGCVRAGTDGAPPDLVRAEGDIVEIGTSARWTLTFAEPLRLPDAEGHPFRVDIVLRDPEVPELSFDYYRDMNRLVRVDATIERPTEIYLLPERASNVFNPPVVEGSTMRIQVPGRTLSDDEDLTGTSPGLEALRWTVIVRDEGACDFLGNGEPHHRMVRRADAASGAPDVDVAGPPPGPAPGRGPDSPGPLAWAAVGAVALLAVAAGLSLRSRPS